MQFYQQRIAITFADVFYPTRIRPQKLLRLREKDPEHNWMDVGWGQYVLLPLSRRQTAFRRFYRPERVPTKHLPPYPATNIIMYTSIALPMAQLSTLNIYSCIGQERCVWFGGSGFVWSSIGSIHTLNKMKTYE